MNVYGILQLGIKMTRNKYLTTVTGHHTDISETVLIVSARDFLFRKINRGPGLASRHGTTCLHHRTVGNFSVAEEKPLGEVRTAGLAQPTTTIFDPIQFLHFFSGLCPKSFIPSTFRQLRLPW